MGAAKSENTRTAQVVKHHAVEDQRPLGGPHTRLPKPPRDDPALGRVVRPQLRRQLFRPLRPMSAVSKHKNWPQWGAPCVWRRACFAWPCPSCSRRRVQTCACPSCASRPWHSHSCPAWPAWRPLPIAMLCVRMSVSAYGARSHCTVDCRQMEQVVSHHCARVGAGSTHRYVLKCALVQKATNLTVTLLRSSVAGLALNRLACS